MEFGLEPDDVERIRAIFKAHPHVRTVTIFGSRAMGNYKAGSDIDLAVSGDKLIFSDVLDLSNDLDKLGLLYRFDLQLLSAIKDADVLAHIQRVGKTLYP